MASPSNSPARLMTNDSRDTTMSSRVARVFAATSLYMKTVANEPSVGMYYVQEHVKNSVPRILATKSKVAETSMKAQHSRLDVQAGLEKLDLIRDFGVPCVRGMQARVAEISSGLDRLKDVR